MVLPLATEHQVKDSIMIRNEVNDETSTLTSQFGIQARSDCPDGGARL